MSTCQRRCANNLLSGFLTAMVSMVVTFTPSLFAQPISDLHELTAAVSISPSIERDVDVEATICATSRPELGVLILKDESGVELLQLGNLERGLQPGDRIRIRGESCLLRRREMGVQVSVSPVVNNDGLHSIQTETGRAELKAGKIPLRLEWFNYWRRLDLGVSWGGDNRTPAPMAASDLWHAVVTESGATNFVPGLWAECYQGSWEVLPDFDLLEPTKTGTVTNFDLSIRPRDEKVGIRYSGFMEVPQDGIYQFSVWSDDGAMLFLGSPTVPVVRLGQTEVPTPAPSSLLQIGFTDLNERRWITLEGRVSFVSRTGGGLELDVGTDRHVISVRLADAAGLDPEILVNSRVQVTGLGCPVMILDQSLVLGKLFVASTNDLLLVEQGLGHAAPEVPISSMAQVQSLPIERAKEALPVRVHGIVTSAIKTSQEHWMSIQDDTRGIFVDMMAIPQAAPAVGELWEVEGHSSAGDFAPVIIADKVARLGEGLLPTPVKPTWADLLNGSQDVQWAELKGLVSEIHSNTISLQLPEGRLDVELEGRFESELKPLLKAVVRIRGVLYAIWDAATREVRVGRVMMRNSTISTDIPAPTDPFDAVLKTPRELLQFDAQASAFRPVRVRGQVLYADPAQVFIQEHGTGLRLLTVESTDVRPGDLVEAVGYPGIGRTELLLREALLKKTGEKPLPPPKTASDSDPAQEDLNLTRVRVEGRLLGWHAERGAPVLEMRSGPRLFLARVAPGGPSLTSLRPGSRLALKGVYVARGLNQDAGTSSESFELLLNSLADISVLSQPSWWTLPRLLALTGALLVILIIIVVWNTQLRRLVEQRTHQLRLEIRERERVERQHALEAERSRIARDLHDDLGSSLTEITVLANTGQLPQTSADGRPGLFQAIGAKARKLISALDVIVWAVDPEDNSLQSLADYLSGYTDDFFSHTSIACRFRVPMSFPPITLEGRVRHDLLMAVKEALNNIVRHADATEAEFRMGMADGTLAIDIADNGKGIDEETRTDGHGLKNLSARLQELGGDCAVESRADGGTIVRLRMPLTRSGNESPDRTKEQ